MNLRCETCRHYDPTHGLCRINPPVALLLKDDSLQGCWPPVKRDAWCGEHEERTALPVVDAS